MSVMTGDESDTIPQIVRRLASAQKSNLGAPAYSRWVNRPAGRVIAAFAYKWRMTPNQLTACSAVFSLAGILVLAVPKPTLASGTLVALLLATGYALDSSDGQLARLRGGGSRLGEWLDHVIDCAKTVSLHLAVLVCWYRFFDGNEAILFLPIAFCVIASVAFFAFVLTDQLQRGAPASCPTQVAPKSAPAWRSIVKLPADYGFLCVTFVLLGARSWFVGAYTVLLAFTLVGLLASLARAYRSLGAAE